VTHYFFDSSALVKRYVVELGTTWVRTISSPASGNAIIAQITPVEVVSATSRRYRTGQISSRTAHSIRLLVDRHASREYMVVGLSDVMIQSAETLLENHSLRAYDSIQLASAIESNLSLINAGSSPLIFVSADQQLLSTASAEGLTTDDPNLHP
jgi:hypothetical protein